MIRTKTITLPPAVGGDGVATATVTDSPPVCGVVWAVHIAYKDSPPAGTTDIALTGAATPAIPVLAVADNATDGWYYPMHQADDAASGTDITNQGTLCVIDDRLKATISGANADDYAVLTVVYEQLIP